MVCSTHKRKLRDLTLGSTSKRPRSCSPSSASETDSDYESDVEIESSASTPATPRTPSLPSECKDPRPKKYHCPFQDCTKVFNRPTRLEEHVRSHTNERPFECPHPPCDKTFLRQSHLSRHVKSAHTSERDYACDWPGCDKKFTTGTRLRRHVEVHEGKEKFRCTGHGRCDKTFRKSETLQRHIETEHMQLKAFRCAQMDEKSNEQCNAGFDSAAKLRTHETRCHGERLYLCSFCSDRMDTEKDGGDSSVPKGVQGFATYSELQTHIKEDHPPECEHCSLVCSSSRELHRHIDIHHSGTTLDVRRTFICTIPGCDKGFTKRGNLNSHLRTVHRKERAFACGTTDLSNSAGLESWDGKNACNRVFSAKATLESHVRLHHLRKTAPVKRTGPAKASKRSGVMRMKPSLASKLTGFGYEDESGRDIACVATDCSFLFKRPYDLMNHATTAHEMNEEEVLEALAEREALSGGRFWLGGDEDKIEEEAEEDWREATGLDVPGVNVHEGLDEWAYSSFSAPTGGQIHSAQESEWDKNAQLELQAFLGDESSSCIDPALANPQSRSEY